jgi:hypothetical protein
VLLAILAETALQIVLVDFVFAADNPAGTTIGPFAINATLALWVAIIAVYVCPLHIQRPTGVALFLLMMTPFLQNSPIRTLFLSVPHAGMEWVVPVMALKYLISHVPRHEPYT